MKIQLISLVYPPETGSARRVGELAAFLGQQGHHVTVITGFPSYPTGIVYPGYRKRLLQRESGGQNVTVRRMYLYTSPQRQKTLHRLLHYLSFTATAFLGQLASGRSDVVYVVSPPYFLGLSAWLASRLRGGSLAFDVQDFWPEAPIALGYVRHPILVRALLGVERFIYRRSSVIFGLSPLMCKKIVERGADPGKVKQVYNWVDLDAFAPASGSGQRAACGLQGKFVVLFAGNMGKAQGLDVVVEAAAMLKSEPEIIFALLGDGTERQRLMQKATNLGADNVRFLGAVPEREVPPYLGMSDVLLVTLGKAAHREAAIPSKIQVYMSSAKPILLSGDGAAAQIIENAACGQVVAPNDAAELAQGVLCIREMGVEQRNSLGAAGRKYAEEHFAYDHQCRLIEQHLLSAAAWRS